MNSKVIAGAIVALVVIVATAAIALSLTPHGQPQRPPAECTVHGFVMSTLGEGLPGLTVTLHVMGDTPEGQVTELYNMTTTTNDKPAAGQYVFDDVAIPRGAKYACVETSTTVNGIMSYGRSNNYTLKANESIEAAVVVHIPS